LVQEAGGRIDLLVLYQPFATLALQDETRMKQCQPKLLNLRLAS
jgi:hypothetical protein